MLRLPFVLLLNMFNILGYGLDVLGYGISRLFNKRKRYVELKLAPSYPMGRSKGPARWFRSQQKSYLELRAELESILGDTTVKGVVVKLRDPLMMGPARIHEIAEGLDRIRESGKEVIFHADGYTTRDYALASAATVITASPPARLYTFGLRFEEFFLGPVLARLGIRAQFIHIGAFKTAMNRFIREGSATSQNLMMNELLDRLRDDYLERISARRELSIERTEKLHHDAPMDTRDAMARGFIDAQVFEDDLTRFLDQRDSHVQMADPDGTSKSEIVPWDEHIDSKPKLNWRPLRRHKRIAVVDLSGMIVQGDGNVPGASSVINPTEVLPVLRQLAQSRRVVGVLLHINSPGGSALASDLIWKEIEELRARKPVVAYCSDVAASGGYYLAVGADRIICRPESLVGSIGVITGKFTVSEAAEKVGVVVEERLRDASASFTSVFQPLEGHVLDRLTADTRGFYRRFLQRVGAARKIPKRRLHRYARGRVYIGSDAAKRGLVDGTGGFEQAVELLHELITHPTERTELVFVPHRTESLSRALRSGLVAPMLKSIPAQKELSEVTRVVGMMQREPTLALWTGRLIE